MALARVGIILSQFVAFFSFPSVLEHSLTGRIDIRTKKEKHRNYCTEELNPCNPFFFLPRIISREGRLTEFCLASEQPFLCITRVDVLEVLKNQYSGYSPLTYLLRDTTASLINRAFTPRARRPYCLTRHNPSTQRRVTLSLLVSHRQ